MFFSFADVLARAIGFRAAVKPKKFVDLGSGIGRDVIAAALLYDFEQARGIELLEDLHLEAEKRKDQLSHEVRRTVKLEHGNTPQNVRMFSL